MQTVVKSPTQTVIIGPDQPFVIIGERINPTGRKKLAEEMRAGDFSRVEKDALAHGRRVADGVGLFIQFGSQKIRRYAEEKGYLEVFEQAGANVISPGCGACIGRHMGVLAPGEVCLFTGNRNFRGRMGAASSNVSPSRRSSV